jgi:hypothetical protein
VRTIKITFNGATVADQCAVADGFITRLIGLIGRKSFERGQGLLLQPCSSIHTCWMTIPIDAVYLDRRFKVLAVDKNLKPWRIGKLMFGVQRVLEIPAGTAESLGFCVGDHLVIE